MDIDIGEEWFGIANGLNSYINNTVRPLIDVKIMFPDSNLSSFWDVGSACITS